MKKQFCFLLETGLRIGEMIGLTWDNIDFENRVIHIERTMEYRHSTGEWRIGPPKTAQAIRDVPMSNECYRILKAIYASRSTRPCLPGWENVVFLNRNGSPTKNSAYDTSIHKLCDKIGMKHFGIHAFRHTFATTALASGWPIKDLSKVLGHRDVSTTMNIYVHTTKESVQSNILRMEEYTKEQLAKAIIKMA